MHHSDFCNGGNMRNTVKLLAAVLPVLLTGCAMDEALNSMRGGHQSSAPSRYPSQDKPYYSSPHTTTHSHPSHQSQAPVQGTASQPVDGTQTPGTSETLSPAPGGMDVPVPEVPALPPASTEPVGPVTPAPAPQAQPLIENTKTTGKAISVNPKKDTLYPDVNSMVPAKSETKISPAQ